MDFSVSHYGWGQVPPFPIVTGSIVADDGRIIVKFDVREYELRAVNTLHNSQVCEDSCVEFFCLPFADDPRYMNIEINPLGTAYFAVRTGRKDKVFATPSQIKALGILTTINRSEDDAFWTAEFSLSFELISELYGRDFAAPVTTLLCNFYKCGDMHKNPHWGSFSPVKTENPDFHRPEFFSEVHLQTAARLHPPL